MHNFFQEMIMHRNKGSFMTTEANHKMNNTTACTDHLMDFTRMPNKTKKIPNAVFNVPYAHGAENMQRIYFI